MISILQRNMLILSLHKDFHFGKNWYSKPFYIKGKQKKLTFHNIMSDFDFMVFRKSDLHFL